MNEYNSDNEEEEESLDFMEEIDIKERMRLDYIGACETAYAEILRLGFEEWYTGYIYQTRYSDPIEGKHKVIDSLISYFESTEEYERCGYLKSNLDLYRRSDEE
jgi:hypothetical protein